VALTPEQRTERARKAGRASQAKLTPEQRRDNASKAGKAAHTTDARIKSLAAKLAAEAPELTPEQRDTLRAILTPEQRDKGRTASDSRAVA
jgi:hypothetical protein